MLDEPVNEFRTSDDTAYRFERDDTVLQLLDGSVVSTYHWRRAMDFTIDPDVEVSVDGTTYEYVDEDTQVTDVHGAVPYGIAVGCQLAWYEETDDFSDMALVLDPDGAVLGGFVEEPFDYEDDDEDEPPVATTVSSAGLGTAGLGSSSGLATESAGRPLVPIVLLVLVVVAGVAAFLLQ